MNLKLFEEIGLKDLTANINSVGCAKCRPEYKKQLKAYFKDTVKKMCEDCQERFSANTLRILDCKEAKCQAFIEKAPGSVDVLCDECKDHFEAVVGLLKDQKIAFKINKRLVRGLDYYSKTSFEIVSGALGSQNAVSGGGRYDTLVEDLGGKAIPAVGFAVGLERIIELVKKLRITHYALPVTLFIATLGEEAKKVGFELVSQVRAMGISADMDYLGKSLKAQMKAADRCGAKYVYIVGEDELKKKSGILKEMKAGEQKEVAFALLKEVVR